MQAMLLAPPPQASQVVMSMLNTRLRRCAQVTAARCSAGALSLCAAANFRPRRVGVTAARWVLSGAKRRRWDAGEELQTAHRRFLELGATGHVERLAEQKS